MINLIMDTVFYHFVLLRKLILRIVRIIFNVLVYKARLINTRNIFKQIYETIPQLSKS